MRAGSWEFASLTTTFGAAATNVQPFTKIIEAGAPIEAGTPMWRESAVRNGAAGPVDGPRGVVCGSWAALPVAAVKPTGAV
ncbi:hypothetical protein [Streptomyces sp. NPDC096030]|uniref:hypothetical protein n=1 Tax=Streptomyces sp. NPDC096030 TaxID=3155423 RepID=UPI00331856DE